MQHRETAEAPAQAPRSNGFAPQPTSIAGQTWDQLTELAAISWSISENYAEQIKLTGQLAKAEWRLSERSVIVAAVLALCFAIGLTLLWSGGMLLLAYLLLQFSASVMATAAVLLLVQIGLVFWCWRSLLYVLSQIGFNQTWQQFKRLFNQTLSSQTADSQTNGSTSAGGADAD
jgi:hypothetical protein